ncbi:hypothetical protein [Paenibacillus methanolicus]|uniref:Uncharacterized protein n=1 Tax=Paenibacillus methanolicus TaxID=582686 RepID=A0A5S5BRU8_9BACL|nr:hypothetical protein [Paenibacillus methanolicus]TYP68912.1 hypothetical protein BCM02_11730 [Paenibacillus methanolicus]
MPIVNFESSRQVHFGTGDILVSPGLLDTPDVVGALCFTENGTGVIGERTEHTPPLILDGGEAPVRMTFDKVESVDVVMRMLEETKQMMLAKMGEGSPDKQDSRHERLLECLRFYGDPATYDTAHLDKHGFIIIDHDGGRLARDILRDYT